MRKKPCFRNFEKKNIISACSAKRRNTILNKGCWFLLLLQIAISLIGHINRKSSVTSMHTPFGVASFPNVVMTIGAISRYAARTRGSYRDLGRYLKVISLKGW